MTSSEINHNTIVIFTSIFPFGNGEPFLETEINYLAERFEKVIIVTQNIEDLKPRQVPANCEIKRIDLAVSGLEKIGAISGLFDSKFWKEHKIIKSVYNKKPNKAIISTMLISLFRAKKIARYAKTLYRDNQQNLKLIFYSYWSDDTAIALALVKKKNRKLKVISRVHGWDVYFNVSQFNYLPFRSLICQNMDAIYSISKKGQTEISETWKQNLSNIFVSHLGVTSQVLKEAPNKFKIVSCSNLISLKRVHLIIEALAFLTSFSIEWIHFGDGQLFNQLKGQANNLPDNIIVDWRGQVRNEDVLNYYKKNEVSCFINVSSSEGIPVSIMEAMSFGIPVIGTNVGGVSEIVDEDNGYLLSANPRAQEIVSVIEKFQQLSNEDKEKKRKAAYSTWENKFNAEKNYTQFVEDILSL